MGLWDNLGNKGLGKVDAGLSNASTKMANVQGWVGDRHTAYAGSKTAEVAGNMVAGTKNTAKVTASIVGATGQATVVGATKSLGFLKKIGGKAGLFALGAGAVVAAPMIIAESRNNRRYTPPSTPIDMDAPLPQVLDPVPDTSSQQTLMGQALVQGERAQAVLRSRAGMMSAVGAGQPDIMGQSDRNVIDGSAIPVQSLGR